MKKEPGIRGRESEIQTMTFREKVELNLRTAWGRAFVRVTATFREPDWALFETILPLLAVASYVFYCRAMNAPTQFTGFVILGGAMTAYWMNVLWSMASQFYWEKMNGQLELYLLMPASRMAILLGMAAGGMLMTTARAATSIVLGIALFRPQFQLQSPGLLALTFFVTLVALYGLGMAFASVYLLWGREAWHLSNLFQEPIYLVSGFYFPVKSLGPWIAGAASIIPSTLGLDAMRQILYPGAKTFAFLTLKVELAILCGLAVLFLFVADKALKTMERLGKETGTVSVRWQ